MFLLIKKLNENYQQDNIILLLVYLSSCKGKLLFTYRQIGKIVNVREILAKNLKENRQRLGITQAELAERASISTNFVAMIELKHKFPAPETLDRLAAALDVQLFELFTVPATAENTMERFRKIILDDLDHAIERAVDKAIDKRFKNGQMIR